MLEQTNETIVKQLSWRYAVKKFDINKKISERNWQTLEEVLRLAPSSYGLQPFQFVVVLNPEVRKKLTPASFGQTQIESCSHLVVVTHLKTMSENYIANYIERIAQVRGVTQDSLTQFKQTMVGDLVHGPRASLVSTWAARQAYIPMGAFMTAASLLNIDVCPMEGFDPAQYEEILGLKDTPYTPVALMAAGYRADDDGYQHAKKVRMEKGSLIKVV
ncbi:MAG: NAD(P)H-dependent oxidoreductase [Bdellovibrionota bacterium]